MEQPSNSEPVTAPQASKAGQWISILANLFTIAFFLFPIVSALLPSSVTLEVESAPSPIPPDIYKQLFDLGSSASELAPSCPRCGDLKDRATQISKRLLRVQRVNRITLTNHSRSTIKDLNVRVPNVWNAEFFTAHCDAYTKQELDKVIAASKLDDFSKIVTIGPLPPLPPNATLDVSIYGDFGEAFLSKPAVASYEGGEAHFVRSTRVSGVEAVIATLGPYGLLALAALLVGLRILRRLG